jgi:hypothetical protein
MEDNYDQIYNSYLLEILEIIHLMLKFKKIEIQAKKIKIEPLPKKDGLFANVTKINLGINWKLNIGLNPLNIFKKTKEETELSEFEKIIRALVLLLEYDKTYPEAKARLLKLRAGNSCSKFINFSRKRS